MIDMTGVERPLTKEECVRWIVALRSGKYKQGRYRLRTEDGKYCCLGVLVVECNLACNMANGGIVYDQAVLLPGDVQSKLANKNDLGVPFPTIADHIEREILPNLP